MSTVTTYLNLVKPAPLEAFSRATYNTNLDLIDAGVKAAAEGTGKPFGHMGRTNSFQGINGGGPAKILMEAAQVLIGGMTFSDADDALVIPKTGRYYVRIKGFFSGAATGLNQVGIYLNGNQPAGILQGPNTHASKMDGNDIFCHGSSVIPFTAGDKISLWQNTGVSAWGTNGYDGSWLELEWAGIW